MNTIHRVTVADFRKTGLGGDFYSKEPVEIGVEFGQPEKQEWYGVLLGGAFGPKEVAVALRRLADSMDAGTPGAVGNGIRIGMSVNSDEF